MITVIKLHLSCTPSATLFLPLWRAFLQITMSCDSYFVNHISELILTAYTQYFTCIWCIIVYYSVASCMTQAVKCRCGIYLAFFWTIFVLPLNCFEDFSCHTSACFLYSFHRHIREHFFSFSTALVLSPWSPFTPAVLLQSPYEAAASHQLHLGYWRPDPQEWIFSSMQRTVIS